MELMEEELMEEEEELMQEEVLELKLLPAPLPIQLQSPHHAVQFIPEYVTVIVRARMWYIYSMLLCWS